jgi:pimeloyl-ACP methyl ester carboxylesterase
MSVRTLTLAGGRRVVALAERGAGPPLLYLHDFADVHGVSAELLAFHTRLASRFKVLAPAHPGCAGSDEDEAINTIDDVVFALLEVLDELGLEQVPVVGTGLGGWIAAELAVRHRRLVEKLVLVSPAGLFLAGQPIADIFIVAQPRDGYDHADLRRLLFARADAEPALELFPNGRAALDNELLRYKMFRFAGRVGFNPPYLHHRALLGRLPRFDRPALILAGDQDALVPTAHAHAYAAALPHAKLVMLSGAGHSLHLEEPARAAEAILRFLD